MKLGSLGKDDDRTTHRSLKGGWNNFIRSIDDLEVLQDDDGGFYPDQQAGLEDLRRQHKKHLELLEAREQPYGQVVASSGLRQNDLQRLMDWGLVEEAPEDFSFNSVPRFTRTNCLATLGMYLSSLTNHPA